MLRILLVVSTILPSSAVFGSSDRMQPVFTQFLVRALLLILAISPVFSEARFNLSAEERSRLLGKTTQKDPVIARARAMAAGEDAWLAVYGGDSRSANDFLDKALEKYGSAEAYERWLDSQPSIHLLDWHKISSDLDFLIVPKEEGPYSVERIGALERLSSRLREEFPETLFYKKFDSNVAPVFFEKYPPSSEWLEPISNIPITEEGVLKLGALNVSIGGEVVNLASLGLDSYNSGEISIHPPTEPRPRRNGQFDTYGNFRQYLRYLRYLSERPGLRLSKASQGHLDRLIDEVIRTDRAGLIRLLKEPWKDDEKGNKLLAELEKIQLYSKDSRLTAALLGASSVPLLLKEAGLDTKRLLKPLPLLGDRERAEKIRNEKGQRLGEELVVYHRMSLSAGQNMSNGSLWMSDGVTEIGGFKTSIAPNLGIGIYSALNRGIAAYGSIYVSFTLSADAVEGVDFTRDGDVFVIKTLNAIARDVSGRPKIEGVNRRAIIEEYTRLLKEDLTASSDQALTKGHYEATVHGLASLLSPESDTHDMGHFQEILDVVGKKGALEVNHFLASYLDRKGVASLLIKKGGELRELIGGHLLRALSEDEWNPLAELIVRQYSQNPEAYDQGFPGLRSQVHQLIKKFFEGEVSEKAAEEIFGLYIAQRERYNTTFPDLKIAFDRMVARWNKAAKADGGEKYRKIAWALYEKYRTRRVVTDAEFIAMLSPWERRHYLAARAPAILADHADRLIRKIYVKQPEAAELALPNYPLVVTASEIETLERNREDGMLTVKSFNHAGDYDITKSPNYHWRMSGTTKLIQALQRGEPLSPDQVALARSRLSHQDRLFVMALVLSGPRGQELLMQEVAAAPRRGGILVSILDPSQLDHPLRAEAMEELARALKANDPLSQAAFRLVHPLVDLSHFYASREEVDETINHTSSTHSSLRAGLLPHLKRNPTTPLSSWLMKLYFSHPEKVEARLPGIGRSIPRALNALSRVTQLPFATRILSLFNEPYVRTHYPEIVDRYFEAQMGEMFPFHTDGYRFTPFNFEPRHRERLRRMSEEFSGPSARTGQAADRRRKALEWVTEQIMREDPEEALLTFPDSPQANRGATIRELKVAPDGELKCFTDNWSKANPWAENLLNTVRLGRPLTKKQAAVAAQRIRHGDLNFIRGMLIAGPVGQALVRTHVDSAVLNEVEKTRSTDVERLAAAAVPFARVSSSGSAVCDWAVLAD